MGRVKKGTEEISVAKSGIEGCFRKSFCKNYSPPVLSNPVRLLHTPFMKCSHHRTQHLQEFLSNLTSPYTYVSNKEVVNQRISVNQM